jgi:hypothetical protein
MDNEIPLNVLEENFEELPETPRLGVALPVTSLIIPVIAGCAVFFTAAREYELEISIAAVLGSALLMTIDAALLGRIDLKGRERESPVALFFGMCVLWIVVFLLAFFRRASFGKPNLGLPALLVSLFFGGGLLYEWAFGPFTLPACDSRDVTKLIEQIVRGTPLGGQVRSIDGHQEISYDPTAERREGQCVIHSTGGDVVVKYTVRWQDCRKGMFEVLILPPDLPACNSGEVVKLLDQLIRGSPIGGSVRFIDGHREVSYDQAGQTRHGQCVLHTGTKDIIVTYDVQWRDRNNGQYEIRIPPGNGI